MIFSYDVEKDSERKGTQFSRNMRNSIKCFEPDGLLYFHSKCSHVMGPKYHFSKYHFTKWILFLFNPNIWRQAKNVTKKLISLSIVFIYVS